MHQVIQGRAPLTHRLALTLDEMTGVPVHFWERYETFYQDSLARIARSAQREAAETST